MDCCGPDSRDAHSPYGDFFSLAVYFRQIQCTWFGYSVLQGRILYLPRPRSNKSGYD